MNLIDFIQAMFKLQMIVKMNHWGTEKYHRHKITDEFHGKLQDITDKIVETYQGRAGKIDLNKVRSLTIMVPMVGDEGMITVVQEVIDMVESKIYPKAEKETIALLDELLAILQQTKYLLSLQ